ncbi:MAG TPA: HK97 family phage prohead protease [Propionibacteriaceae bacterium]|nr:HK97 family phage prohead protease [Propionibacteriaceae bacterium]
MIITRAYDAELEVREDQRQIVGIAVPYGVQIRVGRYLETFRPGAFADHAPAPLTATHPRSQSELPIGVSVELRDEADGLHGVWKISKTSLGDELLELIRDGAVSGLSIGFIPVTDRWSADRSQVERVRAALDHVAIVRVPAYPSRAAPLPAR